LAVRSDAIALVHIAAIACAYGPVPLLGMKVTEPEQTEK